MTIANSAASASSSSARQRTRSPIGWRFSDLWRAPLTDLPVRDELIRQYVPLCRESEVLEIGPGNGFQAYRMSRAVEHLTLLEIGEGNANKLRRRFEGREDISVVHDDLCRSGLGEERAQSFDIAVAIEVFELVNDPAMALRNVARMLRPGGQMFIQFPNYESADWPTYYRSRAELDEQLRAAGFAEWNVYTLRLTPWSQWFYGWMHETPLNLYRSRQKERKEGPACAHQYDETWAHLHGGGWERWKLPIHLYWALLLSAMRVGGDVFRREESGENVLSKNLLLVARTGEKGVSE